MSDAATQTAQATLFALQSLAADVHTIAVALRTLSLAPAPGGGIQVGTSAPIQVDVKGEVRPRSA
jgi:hypothetical protein